MELVYRTAKIEDAKQMIEHLQIVYGESTFMLTAPEEFSATIEQEEKWIGDHLKDGNFIMVVEIEGKIIGCISFQKSKRKRLSHLGYFGISIQEAYCNQGVGRRLLSNLLDWAEKEPGLEKVCLEVFSHNYRAIHLYKKLGFQEEGRKINFVKFSDNHYEDEILMYKYVKQ
ncbi:N-acetyltransferase family protein [Fredinandcohnia humi]